MRWKCQSKTHIPIINLLIFQCDHSSEICNIYLNWNGMSSAGYLANNVFNTKMNKHVCICMNCCAHIGSFELCCPDCLPIYICIAVHMHAYLFYNLHLYINKAHLTNTICMCAFVSSTLDFIHIGQYDTNQIYSMDRIVTVNGQLVTLSCWLHGQ